MLALFVMREGRIDWEWKTEGLASDLEKLLNEILVR